MSTKPEPKPRLIESPPTLGHRIGDPPPWPPVPLPDIDARTHGLRALARWLASLQYMRTMGPAQPAQPFALGLDNIFIEQPDNVQDLPMPSIGVVPGRGAYIPRSALGPNADPIDGTEGIAGPGTWLVVPSDYQETFALEPWASKIAERRSMIAAIEIAAQTYDTSSDLRIVMEDYFGLVATFTLMEREILDDLETARGRRRAHIYFIMTVPVATIGRFLDLNLLVTVIATEGGLGVAGLSIPPAALLKASLSMLTTTDLVIIRGVAARVLGFTPTQAAAQLTDAYAFAVVQGLVAEGLSFETANGRPPYSPAKGPAADSPYFYGRR